MPDALTRRAAPRERAARGRKNRDAEGLFVAEGVRAVEDLAASRLDLRFAAATSSLGDTPRGAALLRALERRGTPVRAVGERALPALAAPEHPTPVRAVAFIPCAGLAALGVEAEPAAVLVLAAV